MELAFDTGLPMLDIGDGGDRADDALQSPAGSLGSPMAIAALMTQDSAQMHGLQQYGGGDRPPTQGSGTTPMNRDPVAAAVFQARRAPPTGKSLFVSGLHPEVDFTDLTNAFEPFGNIISCRVLRDAKTGESRCIGYVNYNTTDAAARALAALNGANGPRGGGALSVTLADNDPSFTPEASNRVFVRYLPLSVHAEDVRTIFAAFGAVVDITVARDTSRAAKKETDSWNLAYVTFVKAEDAVAAVAGTDRRVFPFGPHHLVVKPAENPVTRQVRQEWRAAAAASLRGSTPGGTSSGVSAPTSTTTSAQPTPKAGVTVLGFPTPIPPVGGAVSPAAAIAWGSAAPPISPTGHQPAPLPQQLFSPIPLAPPAAIGVSPAAAPLATSVTPQPPTPVAGHFFLQQQDGSVVAVNTAPVGAPTQHPSPAQQQQQPRWAPPAAGPSSFGQPPAYHSSVVQPAAATTTHTGPMTNAAPPKYRAPPPYSGHTAPPSPMMAQQPAPTPMVFVSAPQQSGQGMMMNMYAAPGGFGPMQLLPPQQQHPAVSGFAPIPATYSGALPGSFMANPAAPGFAYAGTTLLGQAPPQCYLPFQLPTGPQQVLYHASPGYPGAPPTMMYHQ